MTEDEGNRPEAFPKLGIIGIILKKINAIQRYFLTFAYSAIFKKLIL